MRYVADKILLGDLERLALEQLPKLREAAAFDGAEVSDLDLWLAWQAFSSDISAQWIDASTMSLTRVWASLVPYLDPA